MDIQTPKVPVKLAIIGAGNRSTVVYQPLFAMLKPWLDVVAVCDPRANRPAVDSDSVEPLGSTMS